VSFLPPSEGRLAEDTRSAAKPPAETPLTIEQLEEIALAHNPTLAQSIAAIEQERGNLIQAGLYPNPQVGYVRSDPSKAGEARTDGVFLGQEIVTAHKLEKAQAVESLEVAKLQRDFDAQRMRVLNDVRARYFEVLGAQQALSLAEELSKLAEDGVKTTEKLLDSRLATRADLLEAKLQLESVRVSLDEARHRYQAAWLQMATIMGVPDWPAVSISGSLEGELTALNWDQRWQELLANSPQLQSAEAEIERSRADLIQQQALAVPNLNLQTVVHYDRNDQFLSATELLSVPLPVFNRNQGNIYRAVHAIHAAEAERDRVKLALRDQLSDSFRRYEDARLRVERFQHVVLKDAKEDLDLITRGYEVGEYPALRVLLARRTYFQSRVGYVESLTELHKVYVEIEGLQLSGGLNPTAAGAALQTQPGAISRQRGLLGQQEQGGASKQSLPGAVQAAEP
jgi:cobalt-zinc-cadmium efflux system outer membrane protein